MISLNISELYKLGQKMKKKGMSRLQVTAIIPTFNPTEKLFAVVNQLYEQGFTQIIIINDGSDSRCAPIFCELENHPGCIVLTHQQNAGKGRALKTGFHWYLTQPIPQQFGVITLDDDGQHGIQSVVACAHALEENEGMLILGTRDFSTANVPPKSRYGNKLTSAVFALFCGLRISDTQTGLRGIPNRWLPLLAEVPGNRFEYETNMLLAAKAHQIPLQEVPIQTIYLEKNKSTHFRPLVDSLCIYRQLLRFVSCSLCSFLVDISLFWLICQFPLGTAVARIFWATLIARCVSSLVNFFMNRRMVFRQDDVLRHSAPRYYLLCGGQALFSFLLVSGFGIFFSRHWLVPLKLVVDGALFCFSFQIQKRWVFRPVTREAQKA